MSGISVSEKLNFDNDELVQPPCDWVLQCNLQCERCPAYGVDQEMTKEESIAFFKKAGFQEATDERVY